MRRLLAGLVATITRHERYFPEVQWSSNLWTHNVFRFFGMFFGEYYGIRPSTALLADGRQVAYTLEAQIALFEAYVRSLKKKLSFKLVFIPTYQLAGLSKGSFVPYRFAIAFDTSLAGGSSNNPASFTTTGSNLAVFADSLTDITATTNGGLSAFAYGATTLNIFSTNFRYPSDRWNVNAVGGGVSAGTANLTTTGTAFSAISATSYTGCGSSQPDSQNSSNNGGGTTASLTISTTVVASNCWLAGSIYGGASYTAGAGTTRRTNSFASIMDSNGTVGTGSQTLVMNQANDFVAAGVCSIKPPATGPTNVKTWDAVAIASIKTFFGVTTGNTKTVDGIS